MYNHACRTHSSHVGYIPYNYVKRVIEQLLEAARSRHLNELKRLIEEEKLNPMEKDENGDTILHHAAQHGHLNVLKYLINERGLDPACQGENGQTPLHRAAWYKHLELVKYLVSEGQMDPLCQDELGFTPLHCACVILMKC